MEVGLRICCTRVVSFTRIKEESTEIQCGRYWISAMWVEAEAVARVVKPIKGRDYFHRYKVRFDWLECQGIPWWLKPELDTIISSHQDRFDPSTPQSTYHEPHTSPALLVSAEQRDDAVGDKSALRSRLTIPALCDGPITPPLISVTIDGSKSIMLTEASPIVKGPPMRAVDPLTGLLSPPITIPQPCKSSVTTENEQPFSDPPKDHDTVPSEELGQVDQAHFLGGGPCKGKAYEPLIPTSETTRLELVGQAHPAKPSSPSVTPEMSDTEDEESLCDGWDEEVDIRDPHCIPGTRRLTSKKPVAQFAPTEPLCVSHHCSCSR